MFGNRYRYLFILLLSLYSYLNILFTEGYRLFGVSLEPVSFILSLTAIVFILWEGNRLLEQFILRKKRSVHPLIVMFLMSIVLVIVISVFFTWAYPRITGSGTPMIITLKLALGFAFRVNLFLHCVNAIVYFMEQNKKNQLEKESLLKETAEARFDALRNQVNPHFLFNSFNVLSSLVYKDADTAARFIEQLSQVYRYLLNNQTNKVVSIREELIFLDAYIFLLEIRFGKSLHINNRLNGTNEEFYIAPATLQMLIENAIKHNVISKANPLEISIYRENDFIVVENIKQLKPVSEPTTLTGLKNIRQRYQFLCLEDKLVVASNGKFTVKIPILTIENERTDRRR